MKSCLNCGNRVDGKNNFCNVCGAKLNFTNNVNGGSDDGSKVVFVLTIIFTLIYLVIYLFNFCLWGGLQRLGDGLSGGPSIDNPLKDFADVCSLSMLFSFLPCVAAVILSYVTKKKFLIFFNSVFLIINIIFFFI